MVSQYDPETLTMKVYNRYGESLGLFVQRLGGWEFVNDPYRSEPILSQHEQVILDRMQMELNV